MYGQAWGCTANRVAPEPPRPVQVRERQARGSIGQALRYVGVGHGAHDRQDEPGIKGSCVLNHGGEVSGGERQFTRMHVDRAVPRLGQLESGTGMIWVAVSEQDGGGTRIGSEQTLSCLLDQRAVFGPGGIDERPRGLCSYEVDVGLCTSEWPETMHIRRDLPSDRARTRLMRHTPIMALGAPPVMPNAGLMCPHVPQGGTPTRRTGAVTSGPEVSLDLAG